ncbi:MAG: restriction endonuclease subunit S [Planctomycetes bacterium]|nr:restriction endonuclease subunit S [Planctomycetota bacterium]
MDMRAGYKQTEIGVIPEDWLLISFSEFMEFRNGVNADKAAYGKGVPFINVLEVITKSHLRLEDVPGRVSLDQSQIASYTVRKGDIVFNRTSETQEEVGLAAVYQGDEVTVFGGFVIRGRPAARLIDPTYAGYGLRMLCIRGQIISKGQGAIRANIGQADLRTILAPLPSLNEQKAIANSLKDADALIKSLEQLLAKKLHIKQGAMQELLTGKKRLPGFSGEWEVRRLGEICEIAMGRTPPRLNPSFWGRGYKWLSIADLRTKVVSDSKEEITERAVSELQIIPKGTLLMSFKLSIGRLCFAGCDLFTNEAICSFNKLQANTEFMYYLLGRTNFSLYGKQAVKGYTLNKESLELIEVVLPSHKEQTTIATILSDMETEIDALEAKLAKVRQIKKGMMHNLLTGRIRLL